MSRIPPTSWTLVNDAGEHVPSALEKLCRTYWVPVHSYICGRGYGVEAAQDLAQSFFMNALENGWFSHARRERGRFRTFLFASLRNFLNNEWDRSMAAKRGGSLEVVSLDTEDVGVEGQGGREGSLTPDQIFDRHCALAVLESALSRLEEEYSAKGHGELFGLLRPFLAGDEDRGAYAALESAAKMSSGSLRVAVHRLRQRYAELLRAEIAEAVSDPSEIDEEIRHLLAALGNH